jgi:hypothetical protein
MTTAHAISYSRANTAAFVSDKMRLLLKLLVRSHGLDPNQLMIAWNQWVDRAARTWLESGHLTCIVIEFFWPGIARAVARWDFPVRYDGGGDPDMWTDVDFFQDTFAKAASPPSGCAYRVLLSRSPGYPPVAGVSDTTFLSTEGLMAREAGTVIVTPDIMTSARYYR